MKVPLLENPAYYDPETVEAFSDSFAEAVKTIMGANFFLSLALASAMQYLIGMVNALQIITLSVFFDNL